MQSAVQPETAQTKADSSSDEAGTDVFTLDEIARAISIWMARDQTVDHAICKPASKIADVLGGMIFRRASTVRRTDIPEPALGYLISALEP
jgi:hypothetical protein